MGQVDELAMASTLLQRQSEPKHYYVAPQLTWATSTPSDCDSGCYVSHRSIIAKMRLGVTAGWLFCSMQVEKNTAVTITVSVQCP